MYGVSRHTVRMALGRMQVDGLIARGAGRGTFVLPQHDRVRFYLDRSFTQQMAELGLVASSRVLKAQSDVLAEDDPDPLCRESGAPCFRLTRIRIGGSEPIGVQQTTVLTRRALTWRVMISPPSPSTPSSRGTISSRPGRFITPWAPRPRTRRTRSCWGCGGATLSSS